MLECRGMKEQQRERNVRIGRRCLSVGIRLKGWVDMVVDCFYCYLTVIL
jgi:hypothetical protein